VGLRVDPVEEGSNAWAFAPSRTKSGKAILLRNPHLAWNSGYYEGHMTVPGVLDFYGDFRIGGAVRRDRRIQQGPRLVHHEQRP
jgi:acyl-homoserine lactone acylase PvdQ